MYRKKVDVVEKKHRQFFEGMSRRELLMRGLAFGTLAAAGYGYSQAPAVSARQQKTVSSGMANRYSLRNQEGIEYPADENWEIDFSDMSDGPLDDTRWNYTTGTEIPAIHQEAQVYSSRSRNVRIEDGALVIEAHHEQYEGRDFSSARIDTLGIASFEYGTLEFEAQLPRGIGTWPAAWLMPDNPIYNPDDFGIAEDDPHRWAMNGEIDVLEAIGLIENENIPAAHSIGELRTGVIYSPVKVDDPYNQFYTYGLIKQPGSLVFTLNGEPFASRTRQETDTPIEWPYDQSYYIIMNLAMGGTWAGSAKDEYPPHGIDTSSQDSWKLKIRKITCRPLADS